VARYLHQIAAALIDGTADDVAPSDLQEAITLLREELKMLPPPGYAYYRARALLALSDALRRAGRRAEASHVLNRAITLARRHECRTLLERGLKRRSEER
jgi:tetratricopeptide (TPR) repeat protein